MSLVVEWEDIPDAAGYEIYRSKTKFSLSTLPTDKVSVPAGTTEYEYTDVERQTVYWFAIRTLDSKGAGTFGQIFPLGYFPDTGPGPNELLRGTWEFGYFGEVPSSEIASYADIYVGLLNWGKGQNPNPALNDSTAFTWNKCIVNGKIIFFPNMVIITNLGKADAGRYSAFGAWANDGGTDDNTAPIFNFKGRDYQHRLPRASLSKPSGIQSLDVLSPDVLKSELGMITAHFLSAAETEVAKNAEGLGNPSVFLRLGDNPNYQDIISGHLTTWSVPNNGNTCYHPAGNGAISSTVTYVSWKYLPVLELLF